MRCVHIASIIIDVSNTYWPDESNNTLNRKNADSTTIDNDESARPLVTYKPDQWKHLLDNIRFIWNLYKEQKLNFGINISRAQFLIPTTNDSAKKRTDDLENTCDSMRYDFKRFNDLYKDVMNSGYFHHAISFIRPETGSPIPQSRADEFHRFVEKSFPEDRKCRNSKYSDILLSFFAPTAKEVTENGNNEIRAMLPTQAIQKILNENNGVSLDHFCSKVEKFLQNLYITSFPTPYLVLLGYGGKINCRTDFVQLEGSGDNSVEVEMPPTVQQLETTAEESSKIASPKGAKESIACLLIKESKIARDKGRLAEAKRIPMSSTPKSKSREAEDDCSNIQQDGKNQRKKKKRKLAEDTMNTEEFEFSSVNGSIASQTKPPCLSDIPQKIKIPHEVETKKIVFLPSGRRRRRRFSPEEKAAIRTGVEKFGEGYWKEIKECYKVVLAERTSTQIKDCFRTMKKKKEINIVI